MDLFDLLEKFFRGIVYFIYNVVETTAAILRHPIKGPRRLLRAQNNPSVRQIGGLTYLFLALIAFQAFTVGEVAGKGLFDTLTDGPKLDTDAMWPEILAALIATVAIDAVIRLVLRWKLRGRPKFRQALLSMAEFALFWMVGLSIVVALLIRLEPKGMEQVGRSISAVLLTFLGLLLVLALSAYPAAAVLIGMGTPLRDRIRKPKRKLGLTMMGLTLLFIIAGLIGSVVGYNVQDVRKQAQVSAKRLTVKTLRCVMLADGRISADGLLSLPGGGAMTIESNELTLDTFDPNADVIMMGEGPPVDWREGDPRRLILVEPGQDQLIEVVTRQPVTMQKTDKCELSWNYQNVSGDSLTERVQRRGYDFDSVPVRYWHPVTTN